MIENMVFERKSSLAGISPLLEKPQVSFSYSSMKSLNSISPRKMKSSLKKQMSSCQILMSRALQEIDDDEIEITLESAWDRLQKDPDARTAGEHNCIYEIVSNLEIFKHYIDDGNKDIVKRISQKLVGIEGNKDEVIYTQESDKNQLYIVLQGAVSVYEHNQFNQKEVRKSQLIRKVSKGQCINLNHMLLQLPFQDVAICDTNTLFIKLDKKTFRKYLQTTEEERLDNEISFFQNTSLFSELSKEEIYDIMLNHQVETLKNNQVLYKNNSLPTSFYLIKKGKIGIFQENEGTKKSKILKQQRFLEEKEKISFNLPFFDQESQEQEIKTEESYDDRHYQVLKPQSTIFQIHTPEFYTSIKSTHQKRRQQIALCQQNDTIILIFRSSYFIKKLLRHQSINKTILQKRFVQNLEKKSQSALSLQFEQNLNIGLQMIERQHSPVKNSFIEEKLLNDSHIKMLESRQQYQRQNIKSFSLNPIQGSHFESPQKKMSITKQSVLDKLNNLSDKNQSIFSNHNIQNAQSFSSSSLFENNGLITRYQEKIDAVLKRQRIQTQQSSQDQINMSPTQSEQNIQNIKQILNKSQNNDKYKFEQGENKESSYHVKTDDHGGRVKKNKTQFKSQLDNQNEFSSPIKIIQSTKSISSTNLKFDSPMQLQSNSNINLHKFLQQSEPQLPLLNDDLQKVNALVIRKKSNHIPPMIITANDFMSPYQNKQQSPQSNQSPIKTNQLNPLKQNHQTSPKPYKTQNKLLNLNILNLRKIQN